MKRRRRRVAVTCPNCGGAVLRDGRQFCSRACADAMRSEAVRAALAEPLPTPQEIAERAAEIRAEWSDEIRIERMRPDLRPVPWEIVIARVS